MLYKKKNSRLINSFLGFPFIGDNYKLLIVISSIALFIYIVWPDIEKWWKTDLAKLNEEILKVTSPFKLLIYRIRMYPFDQLREAYSERLYEAFLLLIIGLALGGWRLVLIFWRRYWSSRKIKEWQNWFLAWEKRLYDFFWSIYYYFRKVSVYAIHMWPVKLLLALPYYLIHNIVSFSLYHYAYVFVCTFPVLLYICSIAIIVIIVWIGVYDCFTVVLISFFKLIKVEFPRLAITTSPYQVKSTFDFRHRSFDSNLTEIRLKTLVGYDFYNIWNCRLTSKRYMSKRRRFFRRFYTNSKSPFDGIFAFPSYLKYRPAFEPGPVITDHVNKASGGVNSHVLNNAKLVNKLIVPRLVASKLSSSTITSKSVFFKKPISKIQNQFCFDKKLVSSTNPSVVVLNKLVNEALPFCSSLQKKAFFNACRSPVLNYYNDSFPNIVPIADFRFLREHNSEPVTQLRPKSYNQTNFNVRTFSPINKVYEKGFSSVLMRRTKVHNLKINELEVKSARYTTNISDVRLRFLLLKRKLKTLRNRLFRTHKFHRINPFWSPFFVFSREAIILKKIFIFIRRQYCDSTRKGFVLSKKYNKINNKYIQFFLFILCFERRRFNINNSLQVFLRSVYLYNYKTFINNCYVSVSPFGTTTPVVLSCLKQNPWWVDYNNMYNRGHWYLYSDAFDTSLNNLNIESDYFKTDVACLYDLISFLGRRSLTLRKVNLLLKGFPETDFLTNENNDKLFSLRLTRTIWRGVIYKFLSKKFARSNYFFDFYSYGRRNSLMKLLVNRPRNKSVVAANENTSISFAATTLVVFFAFSIIYCLNNFVILLIVV